MATYKYPQSVWDYTPDADVEAGDVVLLGTNEDMLGIVVADLDADELGAVRVDGIHQFDTAVTDFEQGDACYYNSGDDEITDDDSDTYAGRVTEQVSDTSVNVAINFGGLTAGS